MFLDVTQEQNTKLIEISLALHQSGKIDPNTYVLDLDTIKENAFKLKKSARENDIELFFMTKQFGRNPLISKAIVEAGIDKAVAVDPWEATTLHNAGIKIGHVGHLVQIPQNMIQSILKLEPDFVTVFSLENAKKISNIAIQIGRKQKILLRIGDKAEHLYNGQEGGFTLEKLEEDIARLEELAGIEIAGLTSFPCLLIQNNTINVTPNVKSMQLAQRFLRNRGYAQLEMNMPSATSVNSMKLLKEHGATQGEPGHSLTGTTPLHVIRNSIERPAMTYVSEVSHIYKGKAYVFGGGFYSRSHMKNALVGSKVKELKKVHVLENDPTSIDYYGTICTDDVNVGDTAIFAFRTQMFVTHAQIAIVKDLATAPKLVGIYDSVGNLISR